MQFSAEQMQQMARDLVVRRARHWVNRVDAALPSVQRSDPEARLGALCQLVAAGLAPGEHLAARDVQQTAQWLELGLRAGAPWHDTRAAALLHGAAALGALWFVDSRLLPPSRQLPLQATTQATMAQLLAEPQGQRFKHAALRARRLRPGLRLAWQRARAQGLADAGLQDLLRAAFAHDEPTEESPEREPEPEPDLDEGASPLVPDAQAFVAHAQRLLKQAGLAGGPLARLCLAGDLLLGLGRCARLAAALPAQTCEPLLRDAIDAAT